MPIAFMLSMFFFGYVLTLFVGKFLSFKNDALESYQFTKDPYIYIFLILLTGFVFVGFFAADFKDLIVPFRFIWLLASFLFAGVIYFLFLLGIDKLVNLGVILLSFVGAFGFVDRSSALDLIPVAPWLTIAGIAIIMSMITLSARVLIGLPGIFAMVMVMLSLGLILIACAGGVPFYLGLMAAVMFGVFACVFQFNKWERQLKINEGAVISFMFLFCMLLLQGVNELAASSMFILTIYVLLELLWSSFFYYLLRSREPHLFYDTVYFSIFERGVLLSSVYTVVFKLCAINIVFALFQLYAQNAFTLPCLGLVINFWLLSKVFYADNETKSIKEINKNFVEDVKKEIVEIKQHLKKD